jgi:hypothetical protein
MRWIAARCLFTRLGMGSLGGMLEGIAGVH